jgi:hypothetical protein
VHLEERKGGCNRDEEEDEAWVSGTVGSYCLGEAFNNI